MITKSRAGWYRQHQIVSGERVRGAIYEISESCLKQLDKYEAVFGEDDEPIEAITYLKAGQLEEPQPSKEYLAVIQQGLRDWHLF